MVRKAIGWILFHMTAQPAQLLNFPFYLLLVVKVVRERIIDCGRMQVRKFMEDFVRG